MIKHVILRWFGDTHRIPWAPAGRAAVRQPVAFRCPCLCFLLHHMTVLFHHPWPLQIRGKSQNKQKDKRINMKETGNNTCARQTGEGAMEDVVHWSEVWKTGRLEHGAVTMSFLNLQWRLPLPSIFTMGMESCHQHTSVVTLVAHNKYLWGSLEPNPSCLVACKSFHWLFFYWTSDFLRNKSKLGIFGIRLLRRFTLPFKLDYWGLLCTIWTHHIRSLLL